MSTTSLIRTASSNSLAQQNASKSIATNNATPTRPGQVTTPQRDSRAVQHQPQQAQSQPQQAQSRPQQAHTPQHSHPPTPSQADSTPGRWQHPRMDEVMRRMDKTRFDNYHMRRVTVNVVAIAVSFANNLVSQVPLVPRSWIIVLNSFWPTLVFWLLRLVLLSNVAVLLSPLLRQSDTCEDVPLTPAQRHLLGLPPMSRPATPQEKERYVTPPRFSRSATPQRSSSASSSQDNASDSPLSGRGTPLESFGLSVQKQGQSSSQSPLAASQLRSGSNGERRRLSYASNRSSPLSISEFEAAGNAGTPTKSSKASVGLNNKWLYERGRGSPRLSGSVFS